MPKFLSSGDVSPDCFVEPGNPRLGWIFTIKYDENDCCYNAKQKCKSHNNQNMGMEFICPQSNQNGTRNCMSQNKVTSIDPYVRQKGTKTTRYPNIECFFSLMLVLDLDSMSSCPPSH